FAFGEADAGHLWVGENGEELEPVVDGFERSIELAEDARGVAGGQFALLDGDVDDFMRPADIASGEKMRRAALLLVIGGDVPVLDAHPGLFSGQAFELRLAAEGAENLVRFHRGFAPLVGEVHALLATLAAHGMERRISENLYPALFQPLDQRIR